MGPVDTQYVLPYCVSSHTIDQSLKLTWCTGPAPCQSTVDLEIEQSNLAYFA